MSDPLARRVQKAEARLAAAGKLMQHAVEVASYVMGSNPCIPPSRLAAYHKKQAERHKAVLASLIEHHEQEASKLGGDAA